MGVYRRPPRPDELYHWGKGSVAGNHKYIAKIGNRYFYTAEELKAFKDGVSGRVKSGIHSFDQSRQNAMNKIGGARDRVAKAIGIGTKEKAAASARWANIATNTASQQRKRVEEMVKNGRSGTADFDGSRRNASRAYDQAVKARSNAREDRETYQKSLVGRAESASKKIKNAKKEIYDAVGGEAKRKAQASAKKANEAKNQYARDKEHARQTAFERDAYRELQSTMNKAIEKPGQYVGTRIDDKNAKENAQKYGHSGDRNQHRTGHADVGYYAPEKTSMRDITTAKYGMNNLVKGKENRADDAMIKEGISRRAAKEAQWVADNDREAYQKSLLGRAEAANRKISGVKNKLSSSYDKAAEKYVEDTPYRIKDTDKTMADTEKRRKNEQEKRRKRADKGRSYLNKLLGR